MRTLVCTGVMALLFMTGCSRNDRYGTKEKTDQAGRELRKDADQAQRKVRGATQCAFSASTPAC